MRSPVVDGGGVGVGTAAAGAGGVGAATTGSDVDGSGAEADDSGEKSAKAATSDSSSTVTKIGWPTIISPPPSGARIFATTPSSCASNCRREMRGWHVGKWIIAHYIMITHHHHMHRHNTTDQNELTSMVALSVSITANESPAEKESPFLIFHFEIVPDSIVGLRAGMPTTSWEG